jgi:hypothetical protein
MTEFLKRVLIGLLSGYILVYYGEFVFWATPDREDLLGPSTVVTWLLYSLMAYAFLCVVSVFKVRSVWSVFLAGAFYGWLEEGVVVQTMYGTPDGPFPMSIAFTGLAWHALVGVLTGWYLVRKVLAENNRARVVGLASGIGLFFGLWAIWWWNEPPGPMKALLDAGRKDVLLARFGIFAVSGTALLVLAHWLYNRLMPFAFRPSQLELWFLGVVTALYYAFITVPAAPTALWVLPPLLATTFWALDQNRRVENRPDAISAFGPGVRPLNYLLLFCIPLVAVAVYSAGLVADLRLRTNVAVYYVFSALGVLLWLASVVMASRSRAASTGSESGAKPAPAAKP